MTLGAGFALTGLVTGAGGVGSSFVVTTGAFAFLSNGAGGDGIMRFSVIEGGGGGGGFNAVGGAEGAFSLGDGSAGSFGAFTLGLGNGFSGGGAKRSTLLLTFDLSTRL